ncbi:MAG: MarR family transcriptional regulator [Clostridiales bacterium GWF2_38_85]|nr:MAG: MarR family transcriptional regulator [Clostridiales bacterium GWF2_38_85]HBL83395.1 MarR family transcriptional regulator [Clostridiales bacterium]
MNRLNAVDDREFIFGAVLMIANKMDTLLDRSLSKYNITSKQWFLLLTLFNLFDNPPTISEVAKEIASSHQNVKQVALKLQEKGLIKLKKDRSDSRATRLVIAEASYKFWRDSAEDGRKFMDEFYDELSNEHITQARLFISKLILNLNNIDRKD